MFESMSRKSSVAAAPAVPAPNREQLAYKSDKSAIGTREEKYDEKNHVE